MKHFRPFLAIALLCMGLSGCEENMVEKSGGRGDAGPIVSTSSSSPSGARDASSNGSANIAELSQRLSNTLNPNRIPADPRCEKIQMPDPVAAAKSRMAQGDLRPFMINGFMEYPRIPGISCPSTQTYRAMPARGGSFVSDVPDVCGGGRSFDGVPRETAVAYNRTIATDRRFRKATGCRAKSQCEEAEDTWSPSDRFNPSCADSAVLLSRFAAHGQDPAFIAALKAYPKRTASERDGLTEAMLQTIRMGKWSRMKMLVEAGADPQGRLASGGMTRNPLYEVFNQNAERTSRIKMAQWLLAHGADFSNPNGGIIGIIDEPDSVRFMLKAGAPADGYEADFETPLEQVLSRLARSYKTKNIEEGELEPSAYESIMRRADREIADRQRIAIMLYAAGARPDDSNNTNWWKRRPTSITEASILLAYAHEKGEFRQRAEEMISYGIGRPLNAHEKQIEGYLQAALRCPSIRPEIDETRVRLCAGT